jgi:26S proteasome regulatory subunit N8
MDASSTISGITDVVVHPLVLLSTVDHFNRVFPDIKAGQTSKRVVGVLLGSVNKGTVDVSCGMCCSLIAQN